jgi:hypothetical protein
VHHRVRRELPRRPPRTLRHHPRPPPPDQRHRHRQLGIAMSLVVIVGGGGLVGSTLVATLRARPRSGHRITGHRRRHAHPRKVGQTAPIELNVQALAAAGATT